MRRGLLRPAIASGVAAAALGGCGETTIDPGKAEGLIRDSAARKEAIESVDCPSDIEAQEGDVFDCKLVARDGSEEKITIQQVDDSGRIVATRQTKLPRGRKPTLRPDNVERLIRQSLPAGTPIRSISCPAGVKLVKGDTFDCKVLLKDRKTQRVTIEQVDALGNIKIASIEPPR
jgi:hypothetical protein